MDEEEEETTVRSVERKFIVSEVLEEPNMEESKNIEGKTEEQEERRHSSPEDKLSEEFVKEVVEKTEGGLLSLEETKEDSDELAGKKEEQSVESKLEEFEILSADRIFLLMRQEFR
jgi:hypothetical protein